MKPPLTKTPEYASCPGYLGFHSEGMRELWSGHLAGPPWRASLQSPIAQQIKREKKSWSYEEIKNAATLNDPELLRALMIIRKHAATHSRARLLAQLAFGNLDLD